MLLTERERVHWKVELVVVGGDVSQSARRRQHYCGAARLFHALQHAVCCRMRI